MWRRVLLAALAARIAAAVRGCCCCRCCCCCQCWRWSFAAQPPKLLAAPAACRANAAACTHPRACADPPGPPMLLLCCCFCCSEAQDAQGAGPGAAEGRHHHADAGRQVGASWTPPRRPGPSLVAARQQQPAPAAATNWRAGGQPASWPRLTHAGCGAVPGKRAGVLSCMLATAFPLGLHPRGGAAVLPLRVRRGCAVVAGTLLFPLRCPFLPDPLTPCFPAISSRPGTPRRLHPLLGGSATGAQPNTPLT